MKTIGLLSDTHGWLDPKINDVFQEVDEIWHAGDIGHLSVIDRLSKTKTTRAVHGNIDDQTVRSEIPKDVHFKIEGMSVWITHIGGYPGKYTSDVRMQFEKSPPDVFVCGHSHILKVMRDKKYNNMWVLNPGAAGKFGFHPIRTCLRFSIDGGAIVKMEAVELGPRGKIK